MVGGLTMKKTALLILILFGCLPFVRAQEAVERVYVSTDREVYLSGDLLWCSLFCVDASGDVGLSTESSTAYLELVARDGTSVQAKIALVGGRGSGAVRLPDTLPTGNYALYAYTRTESDEFQFNPVPKYISVFNTFSIARVKDGVAVTSADLLSHVRERPVNGNASISVPSEVATGDPFRVSVTAPGATVSVSVSRLDGITAPPSPGIAAFLGGLPAKGSVVRRGKNPVDYDGEVVTARMTGDLSVLSRRVVHAGLSSAGAPSNLYLGTVKPDGTVRFHTDNIYGDRELVCELFDLPSGADNHLVLERPFANLKGESVPVLNLSESQEKALLERRRSLLKSSYEADTLVTFLPRREDLLLSGSDVITYHLDDYVRFHSVEEVFVEIVQQLRFRKGRGGKRQVQMMVRDATGATRTFVDNVVVMLDGVVLSDHEMLYDFDAMLLQDIILYPQPYAIGNYTYDALVNFTTIHNNVVSVLFSEQTRVLDFHGECYPVAYPGTVSGSGEDLRDLLYWHPQLEPSADPVTLSLQAPFRPGTYLIVVEGLDRECRPIHTEKTFRVR